MRARLWVSVAAVAATAAMVTGGVGATAGSSPLRFRVVDIAGSAGGLEPTLTVDTHNRIFVSPIYGLGDTSVNGTPVWRSEDGGRTFTKHPTTHAGPLGTPLGGGDSAVMTDKRDYIYATDLWLGDDSISISKDHGQTWTGSPASHRMVGDRNWLAYSKPDDALYQIWNGMDALYVARADLGTPAGELAALAPTYTYRVAGENVGVPGSYTRAASAWPGGIAVDQREGAVYATWSDQLGIAVARSQDKGATWVISHVPHSSTTGSWNDSAWNYTPIGVDPKGNVFVAWAQANNNIKDMDRISLHVAVSRDSGKSWHTTKVGSRNTAVFPAMSVLGTDRVGVSWIDSADTGNPNSGDFADSQWRLAYAEVSGLAAGHARTLSATVDKDVHEGSVFVGPQGGNRNMGDFFSMAVAPNGEVVIAYSYAVGKVIQPRVATLQPRRG